RDKLVTGVQTCALPISCIEVHSVCNLESLQCCAPIVPPTINKTAAAATPTQPSLREETRAVICCQALIFGGKSSNVAPAPVRKQIGRASCREEWRAGAV